MIDDVMLGRVLPLLDKALRELLASAAALHLQPGAEPGPDVLPQPYRLSDPVEYQRQVLADATLPTLRAVAATLLDVLGAPQQQLDHPEVVNRLHAAAQQHAESYLAVQAADLAAVCAGIDVHSEVRH